MFRPSIRDIFWAFARYGNLTFGGGTATIATLHREVVEQRRWIEQHSFDVAYALSRVTPGTNLLAFSTAVGWILRGWCGALAALLAGSFPCAVLVIAVTSVYERWEHNPTVQIALSGASAAVVAVMLTTGVAIIRPQWRASSWLKIMLFVGGSFAVSTLFPISPIRVLFLAAVIGGFWPAKEVSA